MAGKRKVQQPPVLGTAYFDAEGNRTDDPAQAVRGEILEHDAEEGRTRRTWFFLEEVEIKWLPVNESAFLLWVLLGLAVVWVAIGIALGLIL
jgi:hypothetical protein